MAREGLFNDCDAILSWHPGSRNIASYGTMLALQILDIKFYGTPSHTGVAPEKGRSALDAIMIFSIAMEFLREHMIEPMRLQYYIPEGGQRENIVPDYTRMRLAISGPTMADIEYLRSREGGVDDCARAGALATGTDVTIEVVGAFYHVVPNKAGAYLVYENMKAIGAPSFTAEEKEFVALIASKHDMPLGELDSAIHEPESAMSRMSDDSGDASVVAPYIRFETACAAAGSPGHSPINVEQYGMSIGLKGTIFAANVLACTALDLLTEEAKLATVVDEFQDRTAGLKYHATIPSDVWPPVPQENPSYFMGPLPPRYPEPKKPESLLFWKTK